MLLKLKQGVKITLPRLNFETGAREMAEVAVTERRFCRDTDKATLEALITATPTEVEDAWAAEILGADADIEVFTPPPATLTAAEKAAKKAEAEAAKKATEDSAPE